MREREQKPKGEGYQGGFSPEMEEFLYHRSLAFGAATQGRGRPVTYGTGIPPKEKKARKR